MQAFQKPLITRLVIGPNASLSAGQAWAFLGIMTAVAFGIASGFALQGFWPILPFAGLEIAALGLALWVTQRRNRYREVVSVTDEQIVVEVGLIGQGAQMRIELPRAWVTVRIAPGPYRNSPTQLSLEYCGQRVFIGSCLTDEERACLATRLRELKRRRVVHA